MPITVTIADDHPMFLYGLRQAIEQEKDFLLLQESRNGEQALRAIETFHPQIAVLDMDMPKRNGLEVLKELSKRNIDTDIVILTMYDQEDMFNKAVDLGVMGYVLKDSAVNDILDCLRTVASGKQYISPSIAGFLVKRTKKVSVGTDTRIGLSELTAMQRKVLKLIAENKTTKDIAEILFISPKTVERHRANICDKLSISGNNALLRFVLENKSLL
jgi:two-component system response regulator DegU